MTKIYRVKNANATVLGLLSSIVVVGIISYFSKINVTWPVIFFMCFIQLLLIKIEVIENE